MVIVMVYCMTVYNSALDFGFEYATFSRALVAMWPEAVMAFFVQKLVAAPVARQLLPLVIGKEANYRPVFVYVALAGCNVFIMAPCMTLLVTILHNGLFPELPIHWLKKLVVNFPFAFFVMVFYVGPVVRLIFRTLFRKQQA